MPQPDGFAGWPVDPRRHRRLYLRDHEVRMRIGAHDFEKGVTQKVRFNVDLFVPLALSTPRADRLHEVVDYDFIRQVIARRCDEGHVELQETLADGIAAALLAHPAVAAVRVRTEKAEVYPDCAGVGVEVWRLKEAAEEAAPGAA